MPALLKAWASIDVADAIKLLGPDQAYQRSVVRGFAVDALRAASDMELVTYLLQLVQALRYDEKDEEGRSPLASFLSERAARSIAVANFVWWYLKVGVRMRRQTASICRVSPPSTPSTRRLNSHAGGGRDGRAVLCYVSRV